MPASKKNNNQRNTIRKYLSSSPSNSFYKERLSTAIAKAPTSKNNNLAASSVVNTVQLNNSQISEILPSPAVEYNNSQIPAAVPSPVAEKRNDDEHKITIEKQNKQLIKLTVQQAQQITKLQAKVDEKESEKCLSTLTLSDAESFQLKNLPNEKKYDTKFIRLCLESQYKQEMVKLKTKTLKGTKATVRKGKIYPQQQPISPEKLFKIQVAFQNRIQSDENPQRKSSRHFNYCIDQAIKQIKSKQENENEGYEFFDIVDN